MKPPSISRLQGLSFKWGEVLCLRTKTIILICVVLSALALPVAYRLSFLSSIVPDYIREYTSGDTYDAGDFGYNADANMLMGIVEGGTLEQRTNFAESFANKLYRSRDKLLQENKEHFIQYIYYRLPIEFLSARRLLYPYKDDLIDIKTRLEKRLKQEKLKANPFYIDLEDISMEDVDVSFADLEKKYGQEHFQEFMLSPDKSMLALAFKPTRPVSDSDYTEDLLDWINGKAEALLSQAEFNNVKLELGGGHIVELNQRNMLIKTGALSSLALLFVFSAISLIFFRFIRILLLFWTSLAMGLVWMLTLASFYFGHLNTSTFLVFLPMMGLGMLYGGHLLLRYFEGRRKNLTHEGALMRAMYTSGQATLLGASITAATMFALGLVNFTAFHKYGIMTGIGVLSQFLAMNTFFPAMLLFMERRYVMVLPIYKMSPFNRTTLRIPNPQYLTAFSILLALAGAFVLGQTIFFSTPASSFACQGKAECKPMIEFEHDYRRLSSPELMQEQFENKYHEIIPISLYPAQAFLNNRREALALQEFIKREQKKGQMESIGHVQTIFRFLPTDQEAKLRILNDIDEIGKEEELEFLTDETREKIEEMRPLLHPHKITLYQLPVDVLRLFSKHPKGTEDLLPLMTDILGDLEDDVSESEWLMQCKLRLAGLPVDILKTHLERLAGSRVADFKKSELESWTLAQKIERLALAMRRFHENHVGTVAIIYPKKDEYNGRQILAFKQDLEKVQVEGRQIDFQGRGIVFARILEKVKESWSNSFLLAFIICILFPAIILRNRYAVLAVTAPLIVSLLWLALGMYIFDFKLNLYGILALPPLIGLSFDNNIRIVLRMYEEGPGNVLRTYVKLGKTILLSTFLLAVGFGQLILLDHKGIASIGKLTVAGLVLAALSSILFLAPLLELLDRKGKIKK